MNRERDMKRLLIAASFCVVLFGVPFTAPAVAQGSVADTCKRKHGLDPKVIATDAQRKASQQRIQACIKSGGKS
jgi:hypothetical protein